MEQGLCNGTLSICLSVCLSDSPSALRCCGFAAVGPVILIVCCLALSSSRCRQYHSVSLPRKLNTDLFVSI